MANTFKDSMNNFFSFFIRKLKSDPYLRIYRSNDRISRLESKGDLKAITKKQNFHLDMKIYEETILFFVALIIFPS